MRAALYARVSTEDQAREGYSIEAQLVAMRSFVSQKDWFVAEEFVDAGFSARSDARPAFREMIAAAKIRKVDIILVHKLDRFTRSREDAIIYKALLKRAGVRVVSISEPLDEDSPSAMIVEGVMEVVNEWYSLNLSREVAKGLKQRAEQGLWNGALPFGYAKGEDGLAHVVPEEAEVICQAFDTYASGVKTFQQVATWLNQTKFRPRVHRRDRRERQYLWSKDTVKDMLANPFYLGKVTYKGAVLDGRHEPVVVRGLFERVQQVRRDHYRGPSTFAQRYRVYLLSGLVRCHICGEKLWAHHIRGSDYYREESALRGIPCSNPKRYVRADVIDEQVSSIMGNLQLPDSWRDLVATLLDSDAEREAATKERARLEEKIRRLSRQYREVEIGETDYRREREITQARLDAIREVAEDETVRTGDHVEGLVEAWKLATKEERRDLLRMSLDGIYVDMSNGSFVALKPKAAFLPLFQIDRPVRSGSTVLVSGDPEGIRTPDLHRDRVAC